MIQRRALANGAQLVRASTKATQTTRFSPFDSPFLQPISQEPPPSPWTTQQVDEARHLLRAILRECTYLPDPLARGYIRLYALSSFRKYQGKEKPTRILVERRDEKIKQARKSLSHLRGANAGEESQLMKVLFLTYGRTGRRKKELTAPLIPANATQAADGRNNSQKTAETGETAAPDEERRASSEAKNHRYADPLSDVLKALLRSQARAQPPEIVRKNPNPHAIALKIPETNSWGRPMPLKRVANITLRWYAQMLGHVLPPLPEEEWEVLKARSLGKIPFEGVIPRRARARTTADSVPPRKSTALLQALSIKSDYRPPPLPDAASGSRLTPRTMRRCWAKVFAQTPNMTWKSETGHWDIEWGVTILKQHEIERSAASQGST